MKKLIPLLAFIGCISYACSDDDNMNTTPCTDEFVAGLRVKVLDATTASALTQVTVTATDGSYIEELDLLEMLSEFSGAGEREGTYTITVTGDGYTPYVSEPITVTRDECHVITQTVSISLQPAE